MKLASGDAIVQEVSSFDGFEVEVLPCQVGVFEHSSEEVQDQSLQCRDSHLFASCFLEVEPDGLSRLHSCRDPVLSRDQKTLGGSKYGGVGV